MTRVDGKIDTMPIDRLAWNFGLNAENLPALQPAKTVHFGAFDPDNTGLTDVTAKWRLFLETLNTMATLFGSVTGYIDRGKYLLSNVATRADSPFLVKGVRMTGDGWWQSRINWQDKVGGPDSLLSSDVNLVNTGIEISKFAITGAHESDYVARNAYPILMWNAPGLIIKQMEVGYSRVMGICSRGGYDINISENWVHHCARDGINGTGARNRIYERNLIEYCDDDGLADHSEYYGLSDTTLIARGNRIRFCQGMKFLGANRGVINGNIVEFFMGQGLSINGLAPSGGSNEGFHSIVGLTVSDNAFVNGIDRAIVDNLNSSAPYIAISGNAGQAGGLSAVPGRAKSDGTFDSPYLYFNDKGTDQTIPMPDNYGLIISNNQMYRDIDPNGKLSDYGYGTFYTRNGPIDPTLTPASMAQPAISLANGGIQMNAIVSGNSIMGLNSALSIGATAKLVGFSFNDNNIFDVGVVVIVSGSNTQKHDVEIKRNKINLDPFHKHANRGANGTWLAEGGPTGFFFQNAKGFVVEDNSFRNLCRISDKDPDLLTDTHNGTVRYKNNKIYCQPVAIGFNTGNRGIGKVPACNFELVYIDADPASATYGDVLNFCRDEAASVPTSGFYLPGTFVRKVNPALGGVFGWRKITFGANNVLGVDWEALTF